MEDPASPALTFLAAAAAVLSLLVLWRLFQKHIDGRPLLEYEPRRAVPWRFAAALLMLAPLGLALVNALGGAPSVEPTPELLPVQAAVTTAAAGAPPGAAWTSAVAAAASDELRRVAAYSDQLPLALVQNAAVTVVLTAACYVLLHLVYGATRRDLGLPASPRQAAADVGIGASAFTASLAPIYLLLAVLHVLFRPEQGHPLIQQLLVDHSPTMMVAAALTAVIAAPLYEETAFRLVLQGWLERIWTESRGAQPAAVRVESLEADSEPPPGDESQAEAAGAAAPYAGWGPVLVSGTLFGLAHLGQGAAPAPLILLGVMLGYLYHRTHRILPCIVCHMLFNGFTFVMLTLEFAGRG